MLWVVVPAYNEAESLPFVLPAIHEQVRAIDPKGQVLVVDDGSTDGTAAAVRTMIAAAEDGVRLEGLRHNRGKAAALQRGFAVALAEGATEIAMMDADGQDDPTELPRLMARLEEGADLVTGARLVRRDRLVKRTTSKLYNAVTARISGAPGRDFNSGFKLMRAEVAEDVSPMLYGEMHRYLTVIAHHSGHRVAEVPVEHHPRFAGRSKYGLARFWRGFADLLTVRFLLAYEHRPSHLFGAVGLVSMFLGGIALAYLGVVKVIGEAIGGRPLLITAVMLVTVGMQLLLFGLLAELVVHARNANRRERL